MFQLSGLHDQHMEVVVVELRNFYRTLFSDKEVHKVSTEANYAAVTGSSMLVFVICEIALFLLMDVEWALRKHRRNLRQKGIAKKNNMNTKMKNDKRRKVERKTQEGMEG